MLVLYKAKYTLFALFLQGFAEIISRGSAHIYYGCFWKGSSLGSSEGLFILEFSDYPRLLALRDDVVREYDAMGSIVLTANMQVEVLMRDVLDKKRRAIARIDASSEGRQFLSHLVENGDVEELDAVLRRLRIGAKLYKRRISVNNELVEYQRQLQVLGVTGKDYRVLCGRYVFGRIDVLKKMHEQFSELEDNSVDGFVSLVLVEELEWLLTNIVKNRIL